MFNNILVASADPVLYFFNPDSIETQQDSIRNSFIVGELNTYKKELNNKPSDSIEIFKKIGLISAQLNLPREALDYTQKYIKNSADISILNNDSYEQIIDTESYDILKNKYLPKGNILIFIYFYIVFIGFFFAFIINFKKDSDKISNLLIGCFVTVHSIFLLEFALYASNLRYLYPHTYLMSSPITLLYGPLLYFYFKRIIQQYKFKLKDILHLIPSLLLFLLLMPFYILPSQEKLKIIFDISNIYSRSYFFAIVFLPNLFTYIIYGYFYFISKLYFNKENQASYSNDTVLINWKENIYNIHVIYVISYLIYGFSGQNLVAGFDVINNSLFLAMSLMVFYIAIMAYLNPIVFNFKSFIFNNGAGFSKYLKSGLTQSYSEELKEELISLFIVEHIYRDNTLNLDNLSEKLNTTRHNTSQIINEHFNMNFFELINKFRIEEAIDLLAEDKNGNLNIIDIAYEVGYNNKVTFNKAFKKATSLTPTQFIESTKNGVQ